MLCCMQDQRFAPATASRASLLSCLHRPGLKVPLAEVVMSGSRSACATLYSVLAHGNPHPVEGKRLRDGMPASPTVAQRRALGPAA